MQRDLQKVTLTRNGCGLTNTVLRVRIQVKNHKYSRQ